MAGTPHLQRYVTLSRFGSLAEDGDVVAICTAPGDEAAWAGLEKAEEPVRVSSDAEAAKGGVT